MATAKARVWTFITYLESLPTNYHDIINEDFITPFVISPLHDRDIADTGKGWNGTIYKKPHYHNIIFFSCVKSFTQVKDQFAKKLGATHVEQVHSVKSMMRYLTHSDHKEKAQYNKSDIQTFNGADVNNLLEKNDKEIFGNIAEMIKIINDNDIEEFAQMVNICLTEEYYNDYFPLITGKYQFFILNYIKSKKFTTKK